MRCFLTGSTGYLGNRLLHALLENNFEVNVLVRKRGVLKEHPNLTIYYGSIVVAEDIERAIRNCVYVFHTAAYANVWSKDKSLPYQTNVLGTSNVLEMARKHGVKKVVFTSTAGTFPESGPEKLIVDESFQNPDHYLTDYEKTKSEAEQRCLEYTQKGLEVIIVNPTRIFGEGKWTKGNSLSFLIRKYVAGRWRFIPGDGNIVGNYAFIDDVVKGHLKALEYGTGGDKYILGGTNLSYNEFFDILAHVSNTNFRMMHLPVALMMLFSRAQLLMAQLTGRSPLITPRWVKRFQQNRLVSSDKAIKEINYTITPFREAIKTTLDWINSSNYGNKV